MNISLRPALAAFFLLLCLAACSDDDTLAGGAGSSGAPGGSSSGAPATDAAEAFASGCPNQDLLIQGTNWVSCVAGKRVGGAEPFTGKACTLQFDADGGFSYSVAGAAPLLAPKAAWGNGPTGTYSNSGSGARRQFLASVSPELTGDEGEPRLLGVNVSIFGTGLDDTIEVQYLDAAKARQTYNCAISTL